ncbi:sulfate ABC transporter ATP-binding protein [Caulobacter sp. CCUG 60055]|uniref:sulfate/molybdate ABC transporter ATP-binding protein n=1 Tax=Caulobacter sp. CCUG 60055 TaxID=2100090 RepID=UPI001FA7DA91|nr:sulfate/molybdate ABC transporter ATP-binding protein [Caulobacter sp. CCUG 60055]MCI3182278.1 sulfate ABC transporter ATP-binding protein [Caulobacter sp. CCUG 60055]
MTISIRSVDKRFGRYPALNSVSLDIRDGELLALLGPSGSGKTTLLRVIAGLEFPDRGQVLFEDEDVTYLNAAARRVGFVFQQYALFKHMTVAKNVAFGLDVRKRRERPSRPEIAARVDELLGLVELGGLGRRFPSQLSGGQRQRVALARALAVSPRVLLLDEPFGALDATVRKSLRRELRRIHDATGVTTIFVTHDQEEALELADRVAILNAGRIEQVGTPDEVHDRPASPFVCGFVGEANRFEGRVEGARFASGPVVLAAEGVRDGAATAFVRPHQLALAEPGRGFEVTVDRLTVQGPVGVIEGRTADGQRIEASFARKDLGGVEVRSTLRLAADHAHVFPDA